MSAEDEGAVPGSENGYSDTDALDRALSPLRRVVRYALVARGPAPRHVGTITLRHLAAVLDDGVPDVVRERLAELRAALSLVDEALDPRPVFEDIARSILRVDALLGLPRVRPRRRFRRGRASRGEASPEPAPAHPPAHPTSGEAGRGERTERTSAREESKRKDTSSEPRLDAAPGRWTDDVALLTGLDDLDATNDVLDALADRGVVDVLGLLALRPVSVEVVQPVWGAGRVGAEGRAAVGGRVKSRVTRLSPGARVTEVTLIGAGPVLARWEGGAPAWLIERLSPGSRAVLVGTSRLVEVGPSTLDDPELAVDDGNHAVHLATYDLAGADPAAVRALVHQAIAVASTVPDPVPTEVLERGRLLRLDEAFAQAHLHGTSGPGARRLAYDEALLVHLGLFWPRYQGPRDRGVSHALLHGLAARLLQISDTDLTDEQHAALEEIKRDLRQGSPMRRVLTGEVASGKGLVALLAAVIVAENKHQVMVLSPDQATADQRFAFSEPVLRDLGLVARLVADEPGKPMRDAIRRGEVHLVFGTTQLLEASVEFRRLGLIIAGERDVFGAVPPLVAAIRPATPDLLLVTGTPVPPAVLLAAYPQFDVTILRGGGVTGVATSVLSSSGREAAYQQAAEAVRRGDQALIVFPMARGGDVLDLNEARALVGTYGSSVFPGARVKLFHGAMSREDRYRTWLDARDRRADVIVATTHFEAGPLVPRASVVIIEQADQMSLGRLHRVRGQVASHHEGGQCFLITGDDPDPADVARVQAFAGAPGGFEVSARDLEARGLEAMLSAEAQATVPAFQWLRPALDLDVLMAGRDEARRLLEREGLRKNGYPDLMRYLKIRWEPLLRTPCPFQGGGGASGGKRRRRRRRR